MLFPFRDENPTQRYAIVTYALVAMNVLVMALITGQSDAQRFKSAFQYGFVPARVAQLSNPQPLDIDFTDDPDAQKILGANKLTLPPDRIQIASTTITYMFMHGDWFHLISNMWFLIIFGNNVENRLGHFIYALFYALGGLAALFCQYAVDPTSTTTLIGASGAVAAVLGAYLVTYPRARVRCLLFLFVFVTIVNLPAFIVLGFWFLLQVAFAWQDVAMQGMNSGVAWWAHVGGFLTGCVLMPLLAIGAPPPGHGWDEDDDWMDFFDGS